MEMITLHNPTGSSVRFSMDGRPGEPSKHYEVEPGGAVSMPAAYVHSGCMSRIAPALTVEAPEPKAKEPKKPKSGKKNK